MKADEESIHWRGYVRWTDGDKLDELQHWVEVEDQKIEDDERFHYPAAQVQINAPLALIQVSLKSRRQAIKEVKAMLEKKEVER